LSLNYVYFGVRRVEMKMKGVIGLTAFTAVATLGLSYFLLPRMGIEGAGVAWLASQSVASVFIIRSLLVSSK
jgi:O-antigen/teichoic acid export membrane protein